MVLVCYFFEQRTNLLWRDVMLVDCGQKNLGGRKQLNNPHWNRNVREVIGTIFMRVALWASPIDNFSEFIIKGWAKIVRASPFTSQFPWMSILLDPFLKINFNSYSFGNSSDKEQEMAHTQIWCAYAFFFFFLALIILCGIAFYFLILILS